jgi:D-alanyl-D-alanine carboxypeptidase (penicillin-binding protein 5/6)
MCNKIAIGTELYMIRKVLAIILFSLSLLVVIAMPVLVFTPVGQRAQVLLGLATPTPTPKPILTLRGAPPTAQSPVAYLMDADTGNVFVNVHGQDRYPMASTTKIMTAVVALETGHLDQPVTIGCDVLDLPPDASRMGLLPGDVLTMRQLLYGLLLPSGDDAAIAIADAVSKERGANFIDLMNQQAQFLSLTHTHYVNPHGLDAPEHYTSASDLVNLTRFALRLPFFSTLIDTYVYTIPDSRQHHAFPPLKNTNELLAPNTGYPGANGVKTGTTGQAGDCLVFSATRNGQQLVGVVLGAPSDEARFTDARELLDWGFSVRGSA